MKKVSIADLKEGMISSQTICNNRGMLLVAKGILLTRSIIQRLEKFDIEFLAVQDEPDEPEAESVREAIISKRIMNDVQEVVNAIGASGTTKLKNNLGQIENIIQMALKKPYMHKFLTGYARTNLDLYMHSIRTAIISVNLGLTKEFDELNLEYLAICALLHDCGMEDTTAETYEEHPFRGFVKLRDDLRIDMVIALACLQHHEHYDGSGFPLACSRTQIAEFAGLIGIVDFYDSLIMKQVDPRKALFDTLGKKNSYFSAANADLLASTIDWPKLYHIKHK